MQVGVILVVFIIFLIPTVSQSNEISQYKIYDDLGEFIRHPNSLLEKHDWVKWIVPTLALYAVDESLSRSFIDQIDTPIRNYIATRHGSWKHDHALLWTLETLHQANANLEIDELHELTFLGGEAILDGFIFSQSLKHVFGRARPSANEGPHHWGRIDGRFFGPYTSFPSTHATIYFSFSTIFGKVYKKEWMGDIAGLTYFLITPGHNHWISDIWIGYLLGKAIGNYVWSKRHKQDYTNSWRIYATFRPGSHNGIPLIAFSKNY